MSEKIGMGGIFFMISVVDLLGAIFSKIFIPPTRNKSVSELEQIFANKKQQNLAEGHDNPLHTIDENTFI